MVNVAAGLTPDNNIYWTISGGVPIWKVNDSTYTGFTAYQAGTGLDNHSFYTDPMMNDPAYHAVGKPEIAFTLLPSSPAISNGANVCSGIPGFAEVVAERPARARPSLAKQDAAMSFENFDIGFLRRSSHLSIERGEREPAPVGEFPIGRIVNRQARLTGNRDEQGG